MNKKFLIRNITIKKQLFSFTFLLVGVLLFLNAGFTPAYQAVDFWDEFSNYSLDSSGSPVWTVSGGTWTVVEDGGKVFKQSDTADSYAFAGESGWNNYTYSAQVKAMNNKDCGLYFRVQDADNLYLFRAGYEDKAQLYKRVSENYTLLSETTFKTNLKQWYTLEVRVNGNSIKCYVDGRLLNITGLFHEFLPEPGSYSDTIHSYSGVPTFGSCSVPDTHTIDANQYQDSYNTPGNINRTKYRISVDVNNITPTTENRVYVFVGISGYAFGANDFFTYTEGGVEHKSLWELIIARSNYQTLIADDCFIMNLRPDDFINMYLTSPTL